jgi:hypothetical protein
VRAEAPVDFPDARLKAAVEDTLWVDDPTPTDMLGLTSLTCIGKLPKDGAIVSLAGLEHAKNLQSLTLRAHLISDVSPLSGLMNLRTLILDDNLVNDISPLAGLVHLWTLDLRRNAVSDISMLSNFTELGTLSLHRNRVSNISSLTGLTSLRWVDLRITPLEQAAYDTDIPKILANNPGMWFVYDPAFERRIIIDCGVGGVVTDPGEGAHTYEFGTYIWLIAQPNPGFLFARWTGTYSTSQNPLYFLVDQDYDLTANFELAQTTLYVDDNAAGDPAPADPTQSDPQENGTPGHPFDRIQEAIAVAGNKATIIVQPGTYRENINFLGKRIHVTGIDPNQAGIANYPVIEGSGTGPAVSFTEREGPDSRLTGFVITRGRAQPAAIHCSAGSPTIANCLIVGNRSTGANGAAVRCANSKAAFINCTIADNYAGANGASVVLENSHVALTNSILWGNVPRQILMDGDSGLALLCTDIAGGWSPAAETAEGNEGNVNIDPLFVQSGYWADKDNHQVSASPEDMRAVWIDGDYHLRSLTGRWDAQMRSWVTDGVTSPCIDAGSSAGAVGQEPVPNGEVINMGAYGGTAEASKSSL